MIGMALPVRNARLDEIRKAIDAGGGQGRLCIYAGERPYTGGPATSKLAELLLCHPCAADADDAVLVFDPIEPCKSAQQAGKASWARILDSRGKFVIDCSVGKGEGDIQLKTVDIYEGMKVEVTRGAIEEGNP